MHALPSPVPRRNQKPFKPAFFETLKQQHEAEDGVRDVQLWLQRVSVPPRMSAVNSSLISCALNSLGVYLCLRGVRAISRWESVHCGVLVREEVRSPTTIYESPTYKASQTGTRNRYRRRIEVSLGSSSHM